MELVFKSSYVSNKVVMQHQNMSKSDVARTRLNQLFSHEENNGKAAQTLQDGNRMG